MPTKNNAHTGKKINIKEGVTIQDERRRTVLSVLQDKLFMWAHVKLKNTFCLLSIIFVLCHPLTVWISFDTFVISQYAKNSKKK